MNALCLVTLVSAAFAWNVACGSGQKSYTNYSLYHLDNVFHADASWLQRLAARHPGRIDIWLEPTVSSATAHVLVAPRLQRTFERATLDRGIAIQKVVEDIQRSIDEEREGLETPEGESASADNARSRRHVSKVAPVAHQPLTHSLAFDVHQYHTYDSIAQWIDLLCRQFYTVVQRLPVNQTSYERRPILAVKIGIGPSTDVNNNNNEGAAAAKPVIFVDAGMHAREWIAVATALYTVKHLVLAAAGGGDAHFLRLLRTYDFHVFPVVNPDGYVYSIERERLWRKTRARITLSERGALPVRHSRCRGVDVNRNWDHHWGEGEAALRRTCAQIYAGRRPFSEPETAALRDHLVPLAAQGRLKLYVSLHSYGQIILGPWGYKTALPANHLEHRDAARTASAAIELATGAQYHYGTISNILYTAAGTSIDYLQERNVPFIYGFELRPKEAEPHNAYGNVSSFIVPAGTIEPTGREFFQALKAMARHIRAVKKL